MLIKSKLRHGIGSGELTGLKTGIPLINGELLVLLACEGSRATISDEPPLINDLQY